MVAVGCCLTLGREGQGLQQMHRSRWVIVETLIPILKERDQHVTCVGQITDQTLQLRELRGSHVSNIGAGPSTCIPNLEQPRQVIEPETNGERTADQPNSRDGAFRILPIPVPCPNRSKESFALIMAQSVDADTGQASHFPDAGKA